MSCQGDCKCVQRHYISWNLWCYKMLYCDCRQSLQRDLNKVDRRSGSWGWSQWAMVWICSLDLSFDVTFPFQQMSPAPTAHLARSVMLKLAGACAPKGVWKHGSPYAAAMGWHTTTSASWTWKPALSSWISEWWPMENAVSTQKRQSVHPSPSYMFTHQSAFAAKNHFL